MVFHVKLFNSDHKGFITSWDISANNELLAVTNACIKSGYKVFHVEQLLMDHLFLVFTNSTEIECKVEII